MKKIFLFISLSLLINIAIAQEDTIYYDNGKLKAVGQRENGKATGEWEEYYETGQLKNVGVYEKGKATG